MLYLGVGILDFLQGLIDIIMSLVNLAISLVEGIIQLLGLIPLAVQMLTMSIGILPSILVGFATATITICVIFVIVGRNAGGSSK